MTLQECFSPHRKEPIVMITAYDASFASLAAEAKADVILVGDSLGMVVQGREHTRSVTLEQMMYHTEMVRTGAPDLPVISDLPFGTFASPEIAVTSAHGLMKAGADGVKYEGPDTGVAVALLDAGIPVMGHLGLLPQTAEQFKVQGKDEVTASRLLKESLALEKAGVFSLVLECIPLKLAKEVSNALSIPTIGIGAGPHCDGQVLVIHDMLGLTRNYLPKFVKPYGRFREMGVEAIARYRSEVKEGIFPDDRYSYH